MTGADTRTRLLEAALACIERDGLSNTSLEDVAVEAGVSRATLYRTFPGGREQLLSDTVAFEVGRFLVRLEAAVRDEQGIAALLRAALAVGHAAMEEHTLLQQVLSTDRDVILRELVQTGPVMVAAIEAYLAERLAGETLHAGVDREDAARYLTRLFLSYLGSPASWDLHDPVAVERLVATQFLAGILAPA
ncbi:MAG: TetR/AcrR family transcriptional regulator [Acidimicrobiales bacterium]|nr:TetR/AcrR family transcriptional regulator [Acidimicrobiales bacterium]